MTGARIVDVAVGVLIRDDGEFLLAQRPDGKPYAGYWEFPGGKLEAGESVAQALRRELHEELGLEIGTVCPWVVREHVYPHAHVRLHFCRVFDWHGAAHGREGQAFGFFSLRRLPHGPLLEGALPVMPWLALPEVCWLASDARQASNAGAGSLIVCREFASEGSTIWVESAAPAPRRGWEVRDLAAADAAARRTADFLIVDQDDAPAVLEASAIPVFVIAQPGATLATLRERGAHGRAQRCP